MIQRAGGAAATTEPTGAWDKLGRQGEGKGSAALKSVYCLSPFNAFFFRKICKNRHYQLFVLCFFFGGWEVVCLWFCLCPTPSISFSFNGHLIASLSKQPILHKVSWAIGALLMVATGQTWATLTRGRTESHLTYL